MRPNILSEERARDYSELTFRSAMLDSLTANIAVLDPNGDIVAVNGSWRNFAIANHMHNDDNGLGVNYLAVCRSARADRNARAALEGILDVMKGYRSYFYHEYPCHSPDRQRWFALRATPLVDYPRFVVVAHEDISERVLAEMAIRSSNKEIKPD